jgi:hypothetical protein
MSSRATVSAADRTFLPPLRSYLRSNQTASGETEPEPQPTPQRIYLKPGPLKPVRVAEEFLCGSAFSVVGGSALAALAWGLTGAKTDFSSVENLGPAFLIGLSGLVGSVAGNTLGVCLVGNSGGERGSTGRTVKWCLVGTAIGFFLSNKLSQNNNLNSAAAFTVCLASQSSFTVLGFNLNRKKVAYESLSP